MIAKNVLVVRNSAHQYINQEAVDIPVVSTYSQMAL